MTIWADSNGRQVTVKAVDRKQYSVGENYTTTYTLSDGQVLSGADFLGFYTKVS